MKKNGSRKEGQIVPRWQRGSAQIAVMSTALFYPSERRTIVVDDDIYDSVLRTNVGRLLHFADADIATMERPWMGHKLIREAALLLDLLAERQEARDDAAEARKAKGRKAARS